MGRRARSARGERAASPADQKAQEAPIERPRRPRVIVVAKRSFLSMLEDGEVDERARVLLKEDHAAVRKWRPAHEQHVRTLEQVEDILQRLGAEPLVLHGSSAAFDARDADLIVTVGGDGTLLAASHWVNDVPVLGVNSAPRYSVGFFCGAKGRALPRMLGQALEGDGDSVLLQRMAVRINGQLRSHRVLNEALFCHVEPAATSKYILQSGRRKEEQRSSGLWIGPPAGSTGAIHSAGGKVLPLTSKRLQLVVREPYLSAGQRYRMTREVVNGKERQGRFSVVSKMQSARVFLDGPYRVLTVRLGDEVSFELSEQPLRVLGLTPRR